MKNTILIIAVIFSLLATLLTGCGGEPAQPSGSPEAPSSHAESPAEPVQRPSSPEAPAVDLSKIDINGDFNDALIAFLEEAGLKDTNYMISPTSFRAAMALAISGAAGDTEEELLKAMGFGSREEMIAWYDGVIRSVSSFDDWLAELQKEYREFMGKDAKLPDAAFDLQNSIWRNTASSGELSKKYIEYVREQFGAAAENVAPDEITGRVNGWINENTKGLIPKISDDLSYAALALVNTLYLKTSWETDFYEGATEEGDFTAFDGRTVKKDFMNRQDSFRFYEDDHGKLIVLPMSGGIDAVFILGDVDDVMEKIRDAEWTEVKVKLPKFETETSLDQNQLIDFCVARGAVSAFVDGADFSEMSEEMELYISDIIQKTKIKVDEDGIEAAAATAILMKETAMMPSEDPKEFTADEPFRYMILTRGEAPELLFYGQVAE